jgi:hypothetical protein
MPVKDKMPKFVGTGETVTSLVRQKGLADEDFTLADERSA